MDVLRRYANLRSFIDQNNNSVSSRYKWLDETLSYTLIELDKPRTFDDLSLQFYGTPIMYWVIADFNNFLNPDVLLEKGTKLKIPTIQ